MGTNETIKNIIKINITYKLKTRKLFIQTTIKCKFFISQLKDKIKILIIYNIWWEELQTFFYDRKKQEKNNRLNKNRKVQKDQELRYHKSLIYLKIQKVKNRKLSNHKACWFSSIHHQKIKTWVTETSLKPNTKLDNN